MAQGRLKHIDNTCRTFGTAPWYWFSKIHGATVGEEHWLVTEEEAIRFAERGRLGVAAGAYLGVWMQGPTADQSEELWLLTEAERETVRLRGSKSVLAA